MISNSGPKAKHKCATYSETALPEPQIIKQHIVWHFFKCSEMLAKINKYRRNSGSKSIPAVYESALQEHIEWIFLTCKSYKQFSDLKDSDSIFISISQGKTFSHKSLCEIFNNISKALHSLGITKIEFVKNVVPGYDFIEDDIIGI